MDEKKQSMNLTDDDKQWIRDILLQQINSVVQLIIDVKGSLEKEIQTITEEMHAGFSRLDARFIDQALRLDRHAALWQTGRRWSARMDDWAEKIDAALETKDQQIAQLQQDIKDLKGKK